MFNLLKDIAYRKDITLIKIKSIMNKINRLPDEQLVKLYTQGNNIAFDVLLKRYESKVFSYIYNTVKNQELAEDLFQDIFVKVVVRIKNGKYTETGKFSAWIMRIVHNHIIDHFRTDVSGKLVSTDEEPTDDNGNMRHNSILNNSRFAINENREQEMIDQQTMKEVKELLDLIPDTQREVVLMRLEEEMSFKEIAEKTNCSINTALGRMRYAILNLRQLATQRGLEIA